MPRVVELTGRKINDSRGEDTLEVSLTLQDGSQGTASVPQGKSTGTHEAVNVAAAQAVNNISQIFNAIKGGDFDQPSLEKKLLELDGSDNKSSLGANSILAVSVAFARASSASQDIPLWDYLRQLYDGRLGEKPPKLYMNMINGGLHADNGLKFQEYLVIPDQDSVSAALQAGKVFYQALSGRFSGAPIGDEGGFAPRFTNDLEPLRIYTETAAQVDGDFEFGVDAAANNIKADSAWFYQQYYQMASQFKIVYLEDPFAEEDFALFSSLKSGLTDELKIVGDDLTTTNLERMRLAQQHDSINGVIIKPNQVGTLGETLEAVRLARDFGWSVFISHRSGETMDDLIADLAWAVMADGAKFGAPSPPERMAKYQRLSVIESTSQ